MCVCIGILQCHDKLIICTVSNVIVQLELSSRPFLVFNAVIEICQILLTLHFLWNPALTLRSILPEHGIVYGEQ